MRMRSAKENARTLLNARQCVGAHSDHGTVFSVGDNMGEFPVILPRGFGERDERVHATARWANAQEIRQHRITPDLKVGTDEILLGAYPTTEGERWYRENAVALSAEAEQAAGSRESATAFEGKFRSALLARSDFIGIKDDRHLVTVAGSRAGKGRSMILPNLALYRGSCVVIDPKGENATLTAARRANLGQKVVVLDPFKVANVPDSLRGSFNPFDLLNTRARSVVDDAALIAEGLVVQTDEKSAHWDESARALVRALLLHMVDTQRQPTLKVLRRFLMEGDRPGFAALMRQRFAEEQRARAAGEEPPVYHGPHSPMDHLLQAMSRNDSFGGAIAGTAATILEMGDNERGSVFSTAARNTSFLDSLELEETLASSSFSLADLKLRPEGLTVYLCLPAHRIGTHARWLRVMIAAMLNTLYESLAAPKAGAPVLFVLDEFAALGRLDVIEKAAGYAAGFGVKIWTILQDLSQIKALYPQSWETFLGNAALLQVFGVSDRETTEFVSKLAGDMETRRVVRSVSHNQGETVATPASQSRARSLPGHSMAHTMFNLATGALSDQGVTRQSGLSASDSEGLHVVPLIRPDEVGQFFAREAGASIVLLKGSPPMALPRVNRDEDARLKPLFSDAWQPPHLVEPLQIALSPVPHIRKPSA
jgi:type IV secretion system protein VirD4